jgi:hypothetical protein
VVGEVPIIFEGPLQSRQEWPVVMLTGGTVKVDGHVRHTRKKQHADARAQSLAKVAQYVLKHLTKDHDKGLRGRQMCFDVPPGHRVARHWMNSFGDCWLLDTEPDAFQKYNQLLYLPILD